MLKFKLLLYFLKNRNLYNFISFHFNFKIYLKIQNFTKLINSNLLSFLQFLLSSLNNFQLADKSYIPKPFYLTFFIKSYSSYFSEANCKKFNNYNY